MPDVIERFIPVTYRFSCSTKSQNAIQTEHLPAKNGQDNGVSMKFSSKIVLCSAIPAVLFAVGLATSITSLMSTRSQFDNYISTEQALERSISEMYAQGLQMGQALRNVVLDPSNKKGVDNFLAAQVAYEKAYDEAKKISPPRAWQSCPSCAPSMRRHKKKSSPSSKTKVMPPRC